MHIYTSGDFVDMTLKKEESVEKTIIKLSLGSLWGILVAVFVLGGTIAKFNFDTRERIEKLYLDNQQQHERMNMQLNNIELKQQLFVLKANVENAMLYLSDYTEAKNDSEVRMEIRTLLKQ